MAPRILASANVAAQDRDFDALTAAVTRPVVAPALHILFGVVVGVGAMVLLLLF